MLRNWPLSPGPVMHNEGSRQKNSPGLKTNVLSDDPVPFVEALAKMLRDPALEQSLGIDEQIRWQLRDCLDSPSFHTWSERDVKDITIIGRNRSGKRFEVHRSRKGHSVTTGTSGYGPTDAGVGLGGVRELQGVSHADVSRCGGSPPSCPPGIFYSVRGDRYSTTQVLPHSAARQPPCVPTPSPAFHASKSVGVNFDQALQRMTMPIDLADCERPSEPQVCVVLLIVAATQNHHHQQLQPKDQTVNHVQKQQVKEEKDDNNQQKQQQLHRATQLQPEHQHRSHEYEHEHEHEQQAQRWQKKQQQHSDVHADRYNKLSSPRAAMCSHFAKGRCVFGDACWYLHSKEGLAKREGQLAAIATPDARAESPAVITSPPSSDATVLASSVAVVSSDAPGAAVHAPEAVTSTVAADDHIERNMRMSALQQQQHKQNMQRFSQPQEHQRKPLGLSHPPSSSQASQLQLELRKVNHKTMLCMFFENGFCARGDACTYAHGASEMRLRSKLSRTDLCIYYFTKGSCMLGEACLYKHSKEGLSGPHAKREGQFEDVVCSPDDGVASSSVLALPLSSDAAVPAKTAPDAVTHQHSSSEASQTQLELRKIKHKTRLCTSFVQGFCMHGDACFDAHGVSEVRLLPKLSCSVKCTHFMKGTCMFGEACWYMHSNVDLGGKREVKLVDAVCLPRDGAASSSVITPSPSSDARVPASSTAGVPEASGAALQAPAAAVSASIADTSDVETQGCHVVFDSATVSAHGAVTKKGDSLATAAVSVSPVSQRLAPIDSPAETIRALSSEHRMWVRHSSLPDQHFGLWVCENDRSKSFREEQPGDWERYLDPTNEYKLYWYNRLTEEWFYTSG